METDKIFRRPLLNRSIGLFGPDLYSWIKFDIAWTQRNAVTTLCRILYTIDTGRIVSKKAALVWAKESLDTRWADLILYALDERDLGWDTSELPRPGSVDETLAFAEYAKQLADSAIPSREFK